MPNLICLSPVLSIQTFPRSLEELHVVADAMGAIWELSEDGSVQIVCTEFFRDMVSEFDWTNADGLKAEIYKFLALWFLNGGSGRAEFDLRETVEYQPHPIPVLCNEEDGMAELWADEMGRMLAFHDARLGNHEFCIGVACERAFSGAQLGQYDAEHPRAFPLVGPTTLSTSLTDAYEYEIPDWVGQTSVSVEEVARNARCLGARELVKPSSGGSHFKVIFGSGRPYILDPNVDPQPNRFLKQLEEITGYPLPVIKFALKEGRLPPSRFRLS